MERWDSSSLEPGAAAADVDATDADGTADSNLGAAEGPEVVELIALGGSGGGGAACSSSGVKILTSLMTWI